jgi:hypothetical protein
MHELWQYDRDCVHARSNDGRDALGSTDHGAIEGVTPEMNLRE